MSKNIQDFYNEVIGKAFDLDGYYGAQCPTPDTLIHLEDGSLKPAGDVEVGDKLLGGNTVVFNEIRESQLLMITTDLGVLKVSPDHKFIMKDGSIKKANEVKISERIAINLYENGPLYDLTEDELRFFGMYLADGTKRYRWKNTVKPTIFLTVGTSQKEEYVENLDVQLTKSLHSNKKAHCYTLKNSSHQVLCDLIHSFDGKLLRDEFTAEQYKYIVEGYLKGDGSLKNSSVVATSTEKVLLAIIQKGCLLNGWRAKLSKPTHRKETNFCKNPKDIYRLTVSKRNEPKGIIKKIEKINDGEIAVINTDGDHTYFAENHKYHNCWDGAMYYSQWLGNPVYHCSLSGFVKDIWNLRGSSGILNYYDEVQKPFQDGDIIVWTNCAECPLSHIAIFRKDLGNGTFIALGQNQNVANPTNQAFCQTIFHYDGVLGGFRPKKKEEPKPEPPKPVKPDPIKQEAERSVYRLYNKNTGDHLYTLSLKEANAAQEAGWHYEGVGWIAPKSGKPVYRLCNAKGYHHFTIDENEKAALVKLGWKSEGTAFYSGGDRVIYRMYNPNSGAHVLTAQASEHNGLSQLGWKCEGQPMRYEAL